MWRRSEPVLITSAAESRPEEIRRREQRYIATMLFRVVCFVLAVVALDGWLRIVAVGLAIILPWVAVVVANGGPPRSDRRQAGFAEKEPAQADPHALAAGHEVVDAAVADGDGRVEPDSTARAPAGPPSGRAEPVGPAEQAGPAEPAGPQVIDSVVLASVTVEPGPGGPAPERRSG